MANCPSCGSAVPDGVKFCTNCGTPMPAPAPADFQPAVAQPIDVPGFEPQGGQGGFQPPAGQPTQQPYQQPGQQPYGQPGAQQAQGGYQQPQPQQAAFAGPEVQPTAPVDSKSIWWGVLGFLIPLVGIILYFVWRKTKPETAKIALYGAGLGILANVIVRFMMGMG